VRAQARPEEIGAGHDGIEAMRRTHTATPGAVLWGQAAPPEPRWRAARRVSAGLRWVVLVALCGAATAAIVASVAALILVAINGSLP